jgi:hypothetical protein
MSACVNPGALSAPASVGGKDGVQQIKDFQKGLKMAPPSRLRIKRVYDPPTADDGTRILVDRLWPRGLKKEKARINEWFKDAAPSNSLRRWFGHDPQRWDEFQRRYF